MEQDSSYKELAYSALAVFGGDGAIDMAELGLLMGMALRDNRIDEDERHILATIFDQVSEADVVPKVWARIQDIRKKHSI